jgi:hypothetical protein
MIDRQDTATYLEELAEALASHGSNLAELRRQQLEQRVSPYLPSTSPSLGGLATPSIGTGDRVADTLGNVQAFVDKMNLLDDPTFETFDGNYMDIVGTDTGSSVFGTWYVKTTSGSYAAGKPEIGPEYPRPVKDNPFNSTEVYFWTGNVTASGTHESVLRSETVGAGTPAVSPFLVASIVLNNVYGDLGVETNATSKSVTLEIFDTTAGSVVATKTVDLYAVVPNSNPNRVFRLWVAYEMPSGSTWHGFQMRLRFTLVTSGAGGGLYVDLGEPQMHWAFSADPVSYAPVLTRWSPQKIYGYNNGMWIYSYGSVADGSGYTYTKFQINPYGVVRWGSGAADQDARLQRSAAKTLTIDDGANGAATLKVVGTRVAPPSASQTLAAGTALLANAEFVMFTCTGAVTTTAAPTIADGLDGQVLTILNVGTGTWTIEDQGTLASSNLRLAAASVAIAPRQSIKLIYSSTVGDWVQVGPLVTVI